MARWKPFRNSTARNSPQAAMFSGKFHVLRHLGEAFDKMPLSHKTRRARPELSEFLIVRAVDYQRKGFRPKTLLRPPKTAATSNPSGTTPLPTEQPPPPASTTVNACRRIAVAPAGSMTVTS